MTSLLDVPPVSLLGEQRPRILYVPPSAVSTAAGREAVELAAQSGLILDPWQAFVLEQACAERADHRWAAFEVGLLVPRQDGKGSVVEARELAGLYLFGEELQVYSAHLFDTSLEAFRRLMERIESNPWMDAQVQRVSRSHGEEGIELKNRRRIRFKTRTAGGGRGLTGDTVYLDEAMILRSKNVAALMPTMAAKSISGNPQLWYLGSAGDEDSDVFGKVRDRGIKGDDPSLCWAEWSVDEDAYNADPEGVAADPRAWAQANPGLGIRISAEHVAREQRSMTAVEFARERLSVGTWPKPAEVAKAVITEAQWTALADPKSKPGDPVTFGVDMNRDRTWAAISVCGRRSDGLTHVETIEHRNSTHWLLDWIVEREQKWKPARWVIDARSAVASLLPDLERMGIRPLVTSSQDMARACGGFYDAAVESKTLRHQGERALADSLKGATRRDLEGAWAWDRRGDGEITPVVSATLAHFGHTTATQAEPFLIVT